MNNKQAITTVIVVLLLSILFLSCEKEVEEVCTRDIHWFDYADFEVDVRYIARHTYGDQVDQGDVVCQTRFFFRTINRGWALERYKGEVYLPPSGSSISVTEPDNPLRHPLIYCPDVNPHFNGWSNVTTELHIINIDITEKYLRTDPYPCGHDGIDYNE